MKKILFILLLAAAVVPFQNCTTTEPDPTPTDTIPVKPKPEPINTFKWNGVDIYNLKWDSTFMFAVYYPGQNKTVVTAEGFDKGKYATFKLVFPGNAPGKFFHSVDPLVEIEVTTGTGGTYKKYVFTTATGKDMIIDVKKFDPVGGHIKGTFYGDLREATSLGTATISAAAFEVLREPDQ